MIQTLPKIRGLRIDGEKSKGTGPPAPCLRAIPARRSLAGRVPTVRRAKPEPERQCVNRRYSQPRSSPGKAQSRSHSTARSEASWCLPDQWVFPSVSTHAAARTGIQGSGLIYLCPASSAPHLGNIAMQFCQQIRTDPGFHVEIIHIL